MAFSGFCRTASVAAHNLHRSDRSAREIPPRQGAGVNIGRVGRISQLFCSTLIAAAAGAFVALVLDEAGVRRFIGRVIAEDSPERLLVAHVCCRPATGNRRSSSIGRLAAQVAIALIARSNAAVAACSWLFWCAERDAAQLVGQGRVAAGAPRIRSRHRPSECAGRGPRPGG